MYVTADHFVVASFICVVAEKGRLWWFRVERAYGSSCAQCSAATGYSLLRAVWPSAEELSCQNETAGLAWIHARSAVRTEGTVVLEGCLRRACSLHKQQIPFCYQYQACLRSLLEKIRTRLRLTGSKMCTYHYAGPLVF
jgi:hypothetical protein